GSKEVDILRDSRCVCPFEQVLHLFGSILCFLWPVPGDHHSARVCHVYQSHRRILHEGLRASQGTVVTTHICFQGVGNGITDERSRLYHDVDVRLLPIQGRRGRAHLFLWTIEPPRGPKQIGQSLRGQLGACELAARGAKGQRLHERFAALHLRGRQHDGFHLLSNCCTSDQQGD